MNEETHTRAATAHLGPGVETARVVQVFAPAGDAGLGRHGSGYLLSDSVVLTAAHVVREAAGACDVRRLDSAEWEPAELVWVGEACDAALLRTAPRSAGQAVEFGRLSGEETVECRAVGFPWAQVQQLEGRQVRRSEELRGHVAPLTGLRAGLADTLLGVHVDGAVPAARAEGRSPWQGMSGAAVFSGSLLIGLLTTDPGRWKEDRLVAVSAADLVAAPGFAEALAGDAARPLVWAAEDVKRAVRFLRPPFRTLRPNAAASTLVRPEYGVVPLRGRDDELAGLHAWCAGGPQLAVRLLTGPGGQGKTRLAAELCAAAAAEGWLAGFLTDPYAPGPVPEATSLLVVVDDAQARLGDIVALLEALDAADGDVPRRVLLLAREAGEWWERTLPERAYDHPGVADALASRTSIGRLGAAEPTAAGRERAFLDALTAFAPYVGAEPSAPVPDLSPDVYESVLFVHLAALTALTEPERAPASAGLRDDLLDAALVREVAYWRSTAAEAGLEFRDHHALDGAVAASTLMTADSLEEARGVLGRVPGLEAPPGLVATWLRSLYPAAEEAAWLHPLRPDVLAERHLARVLEADASLPAAVLVDANPRQARQALGVLTETARMYAQAQDAVRLALERDLVGLWEPAVAVAQERGGALGGLLADALWRSGDSELATTIARGLPEETIGLRDLAVVANGAARAACLARPPSLARDTELADISERLARHLAYLNRHDEALGAALEAVGVSRSVANATKNSRSPQLARTLTTLSQRLASSGDSYKGLGASQESVSIYRRMPEPEREAVLHDYASALAMLAVRRCERPMDVGFGQGDAGRDAVAAFDRLRGLPGDPYALERGRALMAFAYELGFAHRYEEALQASEAAAADIRRVAESRPDAALPLLAAALANVSVHRRRSGHASAGVEAAEEALAILRELAVHQPDAFAPQVARALAAVASAYAGCGRMPDALAAVEESVAMSRALFDANPAPYRRQLCEALFGLCIHALAAGRIEAGLAAGEEAVVLQAERDRDPPVAGADPIMNVSVVVARKLDSADGVMNFAARELEAAGAMQAAYACADHAVTVYTRIAKRRPRFAVQVVEARRLRRSIGRRARQMSGAQPSSVE